MAVISNGTTLIDAGALDSAVAKGSLIHIKTLTASSSADLTFVNGASSVVFDGTYKQYIFTFNEIHPASAASFTVNFSDDTSSHSYDLSKQSSSFVAWHDEANSATSLQYRTAYDLANGTGVQPLGGDTMSIANDNCGSGFLSIYDIANTTFVKHFLSRFKPNYSGGSDPYSHDGHTGGYVNTTAAITAAQFKMSSGNIDSGTIKLYGVS
tara:strand:- start:867 stop:1496 length:630 start_codon:yes stop_codon:yes gene_type:complete